MQTKYLCRKGDCAPVVRHDIPKGSLHGTTMDGSAIPGCIFCEGWWLIEDAVMDGSLACHDDADELMFFLGCNSDDKNDLCGEIVFQIENDVFTITEPSYVYIPRGAAHGLLEVRNIRGGIFCNTSLYDIDTYSFRPAKASAPEGTYAGNVVTGYNRPQEELVYVPEGFDPILWIDRRELEGAPYMEVLRLDPVDFSEPETHVHDFDEIIAFLGSDPETADSLNGELRLDIEGEDVIMNTSSYLFVPKGVVHCPIKAEKLDKFILHFSGGGRKVYER